MLQVTLSQCPAPLRPRDRVDIDGIGSAGFLVLSCGSRRSCGAVGDGGVDMTRCRAMQSGVIVGAATLAFLASPARVLADPCGDVGYVGCRSGPELLFCDGGELRGAHCGKYDADGACGWNAAFGVYDCGFIGADPTGVHPITCDGSTCVPSCGSAECGSDGCGGECGSCPAGSHCAWGPLGAKCVADGECPVDMPAVGCCHGGAIAMLQTCSRGAMTLRACDRLDPPHDTCGWSAEAGRYDCGGTGEDPSGTYPRVCPGTEPLDPDTVEQAWNPDPPYGLPDVPVPADAGNRVVDGAVSEAFLTADPGAAGEATAPAGDAAASQGGKEGSGCAAGGADAGGVWAALVAAMAMLRRRRHGGAVARDMRRSAARSSAA